MWIEGITRRFKDSYNHFHFRKASEQKVRAFINSARSDGEPLAALGRRQAVTLRSSSQQRAISHNFDLDSHIHEKLVQESRALFDTDSTRPRLMLGPPNTCFFVAIDLLASYRRTKTLTLGTASARKKGGASIRMEC